MGPFIKSNTNVKKMIMHTINALIPIIIFSFIKNGIIPYTKGYTNLTGLFYPIIFILIPTISVIIYEILYNIIFQKQTNISNIKNNYNIITGILIGLMLPINTPIIRYMSVKLIHAPNFHNYKQTYPKNIQKHHNQPRLNWNSISISNISNYNGKH